MKIISYSYSHHSVSCVVLHWEEHSFTSMTFLLGMPSLTLLNKKEQWTDLDWRSLRLWICQRHECVGKSEEQLPIEERRLTRMEKRDDWPDCWDIWPNLKESMDWIIMLKQCQLPDLEVTWKLYVMFFFWGNLEYFVWWGKCSEILMRGPDCKHMGVLCTAMARFYVWNYLKMHYFFEWWKKFLKVSSWFLIQIWKLNLI